MGDFIRDATPWPWCGLPEFYAALGNAPAVYKRIWDSEAEALKWRDTSMFRNVWWHIRDSVSKFMTETLSGGTPPDLIVSVHPLIHHFVLEAFEEIQYRGIVPVVTVVTDLGSAHLSWFDPRVDLMFVPSKEIHQLAIEHGVRRNKIDLCGLPVREGFWQQSPLHKQQMQERLGLRPAGQHGVVLVMGGGEGFGNLLQVTIAVGEKLAL